ncbi:MAG: hypothetical protein IPJ41_14455 [Phycisphaerales bacterium]|nr:hypothetical protein [Phycisphaerales bacterium]
MAIIKQSEAEGTFHRSVRLDLGDLAQRAEMLRDAATAEAERILKEAHRERARIVAGASDAGIAEGRAEGRRQGREAGRLEAVEEFRGRLAAMEASWSEAMAGFIADRESLLAESRRAVVELAAAIAERVVHRSIELDPTIVENQLRELLTYVAAPSTLVVTVHPDDEPLAAEALPRMRERLVGGVHVKLVASAEVSRGSCAARTLGGATIDATVETQLDRLVRELLPDKCGVDS